VAPSLLYATIEVLISGSVQRAGRARLAPGATVASALQAAGGLDFRGGAVPAGELVLRRRSPSSRTVSVYRWQIFDAPSDSWRSFALEQHDVLVFSWSSRPDAARLAGP
jgi:protein involved in polysaccharide export with SLBB domain